MGRPLKEAPLSISLPATSLRGERDGGRWSVSHRRLGHAAWNHYTFIKPPALLKVADAVGEPYWLGFALVLKQSRKFCTMGEALERFQTTRVWTKGTPAGSSRKASP